MKKLTKRLSTGVVAVALMMSLVFSAYAAVSAWNSFSVNLPAYSGDVETALIARVNTQTTKKYFTVTVSTIGASAVRVWTENQYGYNFSGPYKNSIAKGTYNCTYDIAVPNQGDVVKLNLDNPVNTIAAPKVTGKWTPN